MISSTLMPAINDSILQAHADVRLAASRKAHGNQIGK